MGYETEKRELIDILTIIEDIHNVDEVVKRLEEFIHAIIKSVVEDTDKCQLV